MAITLEQIEQHLQQLNYKYKREPERIVIGFPTKQFKNPNGDNGILLVLMVLGDGTYFKIAAPEALHAAGLYMDVVLRACAMVQYRTPCIQFEFDDMSGEVRPVIEIPVMDGTLTAQQVFECIRLLVLVTDETYLTLQKAAENGEIQLPAAIMSRREQMIQALRERIAHLTTTAPDSPEIKELKNMLAMLVDGPGTNFQG